MIRSSMSDCPPDNYDRIFSSNVDETLRTFGVEQKKNGLVTTLRINKGSVVATEEEKLEPKDDERTSTADTGRETVS